MQALDKSQQQPRGCGGIHRLGDRTVFLPLFDEVLEMLLIQLQRNGQLTAQLRIKAGEFAEPHAHQAVVAALCGQGRFGMKVQRTVQLLAPRCRITAQLRQYEAAQRYVAAQRRLKQGVLIGKDLVEAADGYSLGLDQRGDSGAVVAMFPKVQNGLFQALFCVEFARPTTFALGKGGLKDWVSILLINTASGGLAWPRARGETTAGSRSPR